MIEPESSDGFYADEIEARAILDDINDLVQSISPDGKFLYTNRAWRETLGYSPEEVKNLKAFDVVHSACRSHCENLFERVISGEKPGETETQFITKNGEIVLLDGSSACQFKDGVLVSIRSVFRNVTNRKKRERDLRESEERFQTFMNNTPALAYVKNAAGQYVYVNETMRRTFSLTNYKEGTLTAEDLAEKKYALRSEENFRKVLETGAPIETIDSAPTPDGVMHHWAVIRFPFTNADGQKMVGGVAFDVTERIEAGNALRKSENELKTLIEHSADVIVRFDKDLRHLYVNPALEKATGVAGANFIGKTVSEIGLTDDGHQLLEHRLREAFETKIEQLVDLKLNLPEGIRFYQARITPEFIGGDDEVSSLLVVSRDLTDLKLAEEKLRSSERHYRDMVEGAQGFICTHDQEGTLLSVNLAAATALGYIPGEIIGRNIKDFMRPELHKGFDAQLKKIWDELADSGLMYMLTKEGREQVWKYRNVKLTETVEEPIILGYAQDVTDMYEKEKLLKSMSLTDDLTGLYNRRGFLTFAERQLRIARATHKEKGIFMLFADMDGLKQINDSYGHSEGSMAITKMAELLSGSCRGSDIIARLGGDEFAVLVIDEKDETQEIIFNRINAKVAEYNVQKNHSFSISVSIGITPINLQKRMSIEELLQIADVEMYKQKRHKKESRRFKSPG